MDLQPRPDRGTSWPDMPSVFAVVDLDAIRHNVRVLSRRAAPAELMAVVKADAYGHGAARVAPVLQDEGVTAFAVARPAEGIELREAGITGRILVLGAPLPGDLPSCRRHDLDITVSSPDVADRVCRQANASGAPLRVHIKVDTGMSRLGLPPREVATVYERLRDLPGVEVAGVWTHFAMADEPGHAMTGAQRDRFADVLRAIGLPTGFHTDNTGALMTGSGFIGGKRGESDGNAPAYVRSGIALYGLAPTVELAEHLAPDLDLLPALSMKARVTHLRTIDAGTSVSYGARWTAERPTRLATLGAGYGDGYPRLGSGSARVRIGGEMRPVVGTICMDMCMVDLGTPSGPLARRIEVGDAATLFGPGGPTAYDVARWAKTIPYEICCGLSRRVPRSYLPS